MGDFRMPSLGADMEAGTLVAWHVAPGSRVKRGDVIALVETQKGLVEIEVWENGVVDELVVPPGVKVPVGTVLARIAADGVRPAPAAVPRPVAFVPSTAPAEQTINPSTIEHLVLPSSPSRPRASPAARALARELGVDLGAVHGTGPHGAITRDDVEHARGAPPPIPAPPSTPVPPAAADARAAMRAAIAAAMARSKREIPHYYLSREIDVTGAARWLEQQNAQRPPETRVLFAAALLRATALALHEVPELNGFFERGAFRQVDAIHLGVAVSLRHGGLVAPAIHDADRLSLEETMVALRDVVARARAGTLRSSELGDATITVTNMGEQGTDAVFGVIYPPQVALVGFGAVRERPWAENGLLGVRTTVTATLSADHRVSDGHRGGRFLNALARRLTETESSP